MAIQTVAELKNSIVNWSKRDDLSPYLDDIILIAEKWIFRNARVSAMETALNVTLSGGVATIPLDYVSLKHSRIDGTPSQRLQMKGADWIYSAYPDRTSGSKPRFIAVDGLNFIFGPESDADYTLLGTYYKRLDSVLVSDNKLFTDSPDLYLFASLCELEPFMKNDKRIAVWMSKRQQTLDDINSEDTGGTYSGFLTMELQGGIPAASHRGN